MTTDTEIKKDLRCKYRKCRRKRFDKSPYEYCLKHDYMMYKKTLKTKITKEMTK